MIVNWFNIFLPPIALALDLIFKDFRNFPHPVQGVARLARKLEPRARRFEARGLVCLPGIAELQAGFIAGGVCLLVILSVSGIVVWGLEHLPVVGIAASIYFAYAGLALGGLLRAGREALAALEYGDISEARQAVAMLVSRDVSQCGRPALFRTLAETLSENFNDAVIAPFFWLLLGGPVGLWLYKAASTMDSLWGYRTDKWRYLGFASAKLDDLSAYVPARLAVFWLWLFSRFVPHAGKWPGYCRVRADAAQMESPNAGYCMAAAAWLHHGQMGGPAVYFGQIKEKPILGPKSAHERDVDGLGAFADFGTVSGVATELEESALSACGLGEGNVHIHTGAIIAGNERCRAVDSGLSGASNLSGLFLSRDLEGNGETGWNGEKIRALLKHIRAAGIGGCLLMWATWNVFTFIFLYLFS